MTTKLTVRDETTGGERIGEVTLELPAERISVRELIRSRVYQEVKDFNVQRPNLYCGLVEPADAERALNGGEVRKTRGADWQKQYATAIEAFVRCQLIVTVDDRQVTNLEEEFDLLPNTQITFLKLVPLAGG